jgi:hypothetical protein
MMKYILDGDYTNIKQKPFDFQENFYLVEGERWKGLVSPRFQKEVADVYKDKLSHYIKKLNEDWYNMMFKLQNALMKDGLFRDDNEISILHDALSNEIKSFDSDTGGSSNSLRIQMQCAESTDLEKIPQLILERLMLEVKLISMPDITEYMTAPEDHLIKFKNITTASDEATVKAFFFLRYHREHSYKFEPEFYKHNRFDVWMDVLKCGARCFLVRHYI